MITLLDAKWCNNCASIQTDFLKVFHFKIIENGQIPELQQGSPALKKHSQIGYLQLMKTSEIVITSVLE
jgi:hypothetical protein